MTLNRRVFLAAALFLSLPAMAAERLEFDAAAFKAAQDAGRPVLLHVTLTSCGTCRAQKPIIEIVGTLPEFKDLAVFNLDWKQHKDVAKSFGARSQATLVMFKGGAEVGRSAGDTSGPSIEALMRKAL